ncbi:PucR family transcriptional regulator [Streptomyces sp. NPDC003023]|uniref:PucR family transcriptional regulator n=1 Tax=Streptomyces sp. NPDC003023 TaxID=3364675 RepID=UPI00369ABF6B
MRMTLADVLEHPSLAPAEPLLLTGADHLARPVRWIHSSEVIDIAPLLRGGELLLTGGTGLAVSTPLEQRSYVRDLAARAVVAVAIETGPVLPTVPPAVVEEAEALGFPVIELRRVVPFVVVAESVNSAVVNASVTRLRDAGDLSHRLSAALADGGGVQEILDELVRHTRVSAALFDNAGAVIASRSADAGGQLPDPPSPLEGVGAHITVRGVRAAALVLYPAASADADDEMLQLAQDRASEALQLALLRSRPPSARDFAAAELVRLTASDGPAHSARVRRLGQAVGFDPDAPVIGITARAQAASAESARLDGVLRRYGLTAVAVPSPPEVHALLSLRDRRRAALTRSALVDGLREWNGPGRVTVAVGPLMPDLSGAATSLAAALECLRHPVARPLPEVLDATELGIDRLLLNDELRATAQQLVDEQLGLLLALREQERDLLLATLEAYFETGCNKTRTAERLHLQRQSLYARLQRAFDLLGGDPTGTPRALSLHLALRLHGWAG